ncbi:hypothetical protein D3875_04075 [Deinococcus cavernae]|uniref:Uncharacterized protein n=1 Tax=Deinococcus cavernae TaxID=2320857 RepID=A0A418VED4_9DEIO|nr:hypothetical protein [Deinococcus cavernae]RJF74464.1 hypothetical protein D3875_04075 [Deinococcus cavernae]
MKTPHTMLPLRIQAIKRRRLRERVEALEDGAMLGEVNWGQAIEGTLPSTKSTYRIVDKPFKAYLRGLHRLALGLPEQETELERQSRHKVVSQEFRNMLLN